MKRRALTFDEHVENGQRLKQVYRLLMDSQHSIIISRGKSSPARRAVQGAIEKVNRLRYELDNAIGFDCPDRDNSELNHVYYGMA